MHLVNVFSKGYWNRIIINTYASIFNQFIRVFSGFISETINIINTQLYIDKESIINTFGYRSSFLPQYPIYEMNYKANLLYMKEH